MSMRQKFTRYWFEWQGVYVVLLMFLAWRLRLRGVFRSVSTTPGSGFDFFNEEMIPRDVERSVKRRTTCQ